jgi:dihydroorotate dehydrogenase (fumarate)
LELNLYRVAANIDTPGAQVEAEQHELVKAVAGALFVPLAVKVGPYYSAFANFAAGLVDAGADALVLFNRFYQPDLSPVTRQVAPALDPSTSSELRLGLHWLSLLHGRVDADLAATTGIRTGLDVAKALLAGASVAMMTSALLGNGPGHVRAVEDELIAWATGHGYASVAQLRGSASQRHVTDPDAFERASYIEGLVDHSNAFARTEDPWHAHVRR